MDQQDDLYLRQLAQRAAYAVGGTEAAVFRVEHLEPSLKLVSHIRSDDASRAVRAAAGKAFREIISQCLAAERDGCLCVDERAGVLPQFCLVHFLPHRGRADVVLAVIVRCQRCEAMERLETVQRTD